MRSARLRKTTKEMRAHFAAIQQGVCVNLYLLI